MAGCRVILWLLIWKGAAAAAAAATVVCTYVCNMETAYLYVKSNAINIYTRACVSVCGVCGYYNVRII